MTSGSPIPPNETVCRDLGRGFKWYLLVGGVVRGGPYATEDQAEAAREERLRELDELYEAVEADARERGYRVQW